jgi:hypothetical protein
MTLVVKNTLDPALYNTLATLDGYQTVANKKLKTIREPVTLAQAAPGGTVDFDVATQSIVLYNTATQNFILNLRFDAVTPLANLMNIGESVSVTLLVPNGTTPYFMSGIRIDGTSVNVNVKYQSGIAFTLGNASSTDIYMLFIVRMETGWNVYASQTKYA